MCQACNDQSWKSLRTIWGQLSKNAELSHAFFWGTARAHMHAAHEITAQCRPDAESCIMQFALVQHYVLYFLYWSCVRTILDIACPIFNLILDAIILAGRPSHDRVTPSSQSDLRL